MGARTIPTARFDYNDAVVRSFDHQMLLNLVRLRYQDSIFFLDLTSIVTSYERSGNVAVSPSGSFDPRAVSLGGVAAASWRETPTISYAPLQGEDFAKRLLAPIEPTAILLLSRSGWGLERLLLCTVQQLNELPNGTAIGGVAPVHVYHYEKFRRVASLLKDLQEKGYIQLDVLAAEAGSVAVTQGPTPLDERARASAEEVAKLLNLTRDPAAEAVPIEAPSFPRSPADIALSGRSFLGVMTFLAQHVEVPPDHVQRGLVRVTRGPDGKPFSWDNISGGLFRIRTSMKEPANAFIKTHYRGNWFWIDDSDIESKSTYTLLAQLFSLQSASGKIVAPLLTIPAH